MFTAGSGHSGHPNERRGHPNLAPPPTCSSQPRIDVPDVEIARICLRTSWPARASTFNPTTLLQFRPSFSLALFGGAPSYPSRGRSVSSPITSQLSPDQAVACLHSTSTSHGRPVNHRGCLLRALGELTLAGNEPNHLQADSTIFKLVVIETHFGFGHLYRSSRVPLARSRRKQRVETYGSQFRQP